MSKFWGDTIGTFIKYKQTGFMFMQGLLQKLFYVAGVLRLQQTDQIMA